MATQTYILLMLNIGVCLFSGFCFVATIFTKSEIHERGISLIIVLSSGYFIYYFNSILDIIGN